MIICSNCLKQTNENEPRCKNCGLLLNVPYNKQTKLFLYERINNSQIIGVYDWILIIVSLFVPILNIYLLLKYVILQKNKTTFKNFINAFFSLLGGIIISYFLVSIFNSLQHEYHWYQKIFGLE